MRWRCVSLTASSALLLAGCGSAPHDAAPPPPPRIPAGLAARLAAEADQVRRLRPGTCEARDAAARFRAHVIASAAAMPARYREPLLSAANDLAERLAPCGEERVETAPQRGNEDEDGDDHGRHGKKKGHGDGKGRGGKHGRGEG